MPSKTLLVFCDGTGGDGNIAPPERSSMSVKIDTVTLSTGNVDQIPGRGATSSISGVTDFPLSLEDGPSVKYVTDILRLSRAVLPYSADGKTRQCVFYQNGVGSEADFQGQYVNAASQPSGIAIASKIRDAYAFIAQNFELGDEICLFGFSSFTRVYRLPTHNVAKGGYSARKLAGLIDRIGLLSRENLGLRFHFWSPLDQSQEPALPGDTRKPRIKYVGVWDTVGFITDLNGRLVKDALHIADNILPSTVDIALQALSLQENQERFLPTLWVAPKGGLAPNQVLKQIWFPGAHSDVGGGYKRHELADISLFWMVGEIKPCIHLDTNFLEAGKQNNPDPWGTSKPHNSCAETMWTFRAKTRLDSGHITPDSILHESVAYAPQSLKQPKDMITRDSLKHRFGLNWQPNYAELNEFEKHCKETWITSGTEV